MRDVDHRHAEVANALEEDEHALAQRLVDGGQWPVDEHAAPRVRAQAGDGLDERRLPGAGRSDHRGHFLFEQAPRFEREVRQRQGEIDIDHAAYRFRCLAMSTPLAPTSTHATATT